MGKSRETATAGSTVIGKDPTKRVALSSHYPDSPVVIRGVRLCACEQHLQAVGQPTLLLPQHHIQSRAVLGKPDGQILQKYITIMSNVKISTSSLKVCITNMR